MSKIPDFSKVSLEDGAAPATLNDWRALVGDAELDEGSNQEAIELAGFLGLSRLTMVVVDNASASYRDRGHLGRRLELEGWRTETVDGRDHGQLRQALWARSDRPSAVVAEVEEKWS